MLFAHYDKELEAVTDVEEKRRFNEKLKEDTLIFIKKSLAASPVANENGRNKDNYIAAVIDGFALGNRRTHRKFELVQAMYLQKLGQAPIGENENKNVFDLTVAKQMLEDREDEQLIRLAIKESSPFASIAQNDNDYSVKVLQAAKAAIAVEKRLMRSVPKKIPVAASSYNELKNGGITAKDLYVAAIHARIAENPVFRVHMSERASDVEILERLCGKYGDIDKEELKRVVSRYSSYCALNGGSDRKTALEIAANLVAEAAGNANRLEKLNKNEAELKKSCEKVLAYAAEESKIAPDTDGKVAVNMFRQNMDKSLIMMYLTDFAAMRGMENPADYADLTVNNAEVVYDRMLSAENYDSPQTNGDDFNETIKDVYLQKLQSLSAGKGYFSEDMDVEAVKEMFLEEYPAKDIEEAVFALSPNAMVAGHTEGYSDYVKNMAAVEISREKEKLENFCFELREDCSDVAEEYDCQREKFGESINLPYNGDVENKLVEALLKKGFGDDETAAVLTEKSPLNKENNPDYGKNVVKGVLVRITATVTETKKDFVGSAPVNQNVRVMTLMEEHYE